MPAPPRRRWTVGLLARLPTGPGTLGVAGTAAATGTVVVDPSDPTTVPLPPVAQTSWVTARYGGDTGYQPHQSVRALHVR